MADQDLTNKIEDWLKGQLSEADAAAFQSQVDADPGLAEEVELHKLTLRAMRHLSEQSLQQKVLGWMEEEEGNEINSPSIQTNTLKNWTFFLAGAAVVVIIGGFLFYRIQQNKIDEQRRKEIQPLELAEKDSLIQDLNQRFLTERTKLESLSIENERLKKAISKSNTQPRLYIEPDNLAGTIRMNDASEVAKLIRQGAAYFYKNEMTLAEKAAEKAIEKAPDNREAVRLLGHILLKQNKFQEAEVEFQHIINHELYSPFSSGMSESEWCLLLCLRTQLTNAVKRKEYNVLLEKIINDPKHPYTDQVTQMLEADGKD